MPFGADIIFVQCPDVTLVYLNVVFVNVSKVCLIACHTQHGFQSKTIVRRQEQARRELNNANQPEHFDNDLCKPV